MLLLLEIRIGEQLELVNVICAIVSGENGDITAGAGKGNAVAVDVRVIGIDSGCVTASCCVGAEVAAGRGGGGADSGEDDRHGDGQ